MNGNATCLPGRNCEWSRHLLWGNARPAGFPGDVRWYPALWSERRAQALQLALDGDAEHACPVPIFTWGSAEDFEDGNRFGWVAVDCGARNFGGTTPALANDTR